MKVGVRFFGPLAQLAGQEMADFALPEGATYGHLLEEIDRRLGHRLHERLWDKEARSFRRGILVMGEGRDLDSPETPLHDGEEIKVVPVLAGG